MKQAVFYHLSKSVPPMDQMTWNFSCRGLLWVSIEFWSMLWIIIDFESWLNTCSYIKIQHFSASFIMVIIANLLLTIFQMYMRKKEAYKDRLLNVLYCHYVFILHFGSLINFVLILIGLEIFEIEEEMFSNLLLMIRYVHLTILFNNLLLIGIGRSHLKCWTLISVYVTLP